MGTNASPPPTCGSTVDVPLGWGDGEACGVGWGDGDSTISQEASASVRLDERPAGSGAQPGHPASTSTGEQPDEQTTPPSITGETADESMVTTTPRDPALASPVPTDVSNSDEAGSVVAARSLASTAARVVAPDALQPAAGGGTSTDTTALEPAAYDCAGPGALPDDGAVRDCRGTPPLVPTGKTCDCGAPGAYVSEMPAAMPTATCIRRASSDGESAAPLTAPEAGALIATGTSMRIPQAAALTAGAVEQMPHASSDAGASQHLPPTSTTEQKATLGSPGSVATRTNARTGDEAAPMTPEPSQGCAVNTNWKPEPMRSLRSATLTPGNSATPLRTATDVTTPEDPELDAVAAARRPETSPSRSAEYTARCTTVLVSDATGVPKSSTSITRGSGAREAPWISTGGTRSMRMPVTAPARPVMWYWPVVK
mmetsp:Transcript_18714/g.71190  ORF Transcript_18714/g.71190 Transcript_18714/m.71190 type:complete len:428 (-) Transcript_18714:1539-2822(-)